MSQPAPPENLVVTVAAGYTEAQIRPFLASLRQFSPDASLKVIVYRHDPEFERAIRGWFPNCSFHLLPASFLRDFALNRKWARSILKRLALWSHSRYLGKRLLKVVYLRHIVVRDLLAAANLNEGNILMCDSRDVVFQADPFSREWPPLWTCEEDRLMEECLVNSKWLRRAGGESAVTQVKHHQVVCAGVIGGRVDKMRRYLQCSSEIVERIASQVALVGGDQGIHNYLVRLRPELGFTVFPNGTLAANFSFTEPGDVAVRNNQVHVRNNSDVPAIVHQYDRISSLVEWVESRWANAKPSN